MTQTSLPLLERLRGARETRLSTSAIDALSLVAYRQPVGKSEIDAIRGVDWAASAAALKLFAIGAASTEGGRVIYSTTSRFLSLFHLQSLDDLPQTQDLERL